LTSAIVNYILWRLSILWFHQLWVVIIRLLPLVIATTVCGEQFIIENRLHVPVGVVAAGEVAWFPMGETKCELPGSWAVSWGGATNSPGVSATGSEWTRVRIWESSTNTIATLVTGETGFKAAFEQGTTIGLGAGLLLIVATVGRRFLRMGTYGGGE